MNNFGVIELASAKTTSAPGWAYVPDTGRNASAALQPSNRKRARAVPGLSAGDQTAREEARVRKELEALERDAGKDNSIPVPARSGARAHEKPSSNVRRILQSQKTFANHLDDFLALQAQTESAVNAANRVVASAHASASKRPAPAKKSTVTTTHSSIKQRALPEEDTAMTDAADTAASTPPSPAHPEDADPLLASRVPDTPSEAELRSLLSRPPLTYVEARGRWDGVGGAGGGGRGTMATTTTRAKRTFCAVCGYWGRVRCVKCGTRVCALDCLETHREDCVTRYGL